MAEYQAGAAHFNHFGRYRKHVVQPRWGVVAATQLVDQEKYALHIGQVRQVDSRLVEKLGARPLHEGEVLRVEHHAPCVGVLVIDPDRNFQLSDSRSRGAEGATMPKCRYAESVATRPRGVRCR